MPAAKQSLFRYAHYRLLALGMALLFVATFLVYVWTEKQIDRANETRQQSVQLAHLLRQSSDDLTRMARSYVASGDPLHRSHYLEVLAIRDGRAPRPLDYDLVYWELVGPGDRRPRGFGPAVGLLELMRRTGFTPEEFDQLALAKANSDLLSRTELAAMALIEAESGNSAQHTAQAIRMLYGQPYHQAKGRIMAPILAFQRMTNERTLAAVHRAETHATWMRLAFVLAGLALVSLLSQALRNLRNALGASVHTLHGAIERLGSGDFCTTVVVEQGSEGSVLGWLAQTRRKLAAIDARRGEAEQHNTHLSRLYSALSHCNQIIVRCADEQDLYARICDNVVRHGGMRMAWIGMLETNGVDIHPVAWSGTGTEYVRALRLTISERAPNCLGPTGTALREDRPHWCQDFEHADNTMPWRDQGAEYGWKSSACLPLHRDGKVVGGLTLYTDSAGAFGDDVRNLLIEMTQDIDFALKNFDREAQRTRVAAALQASEQHLRAIIETEPDGILVLAADGRVLAMNRAGLLTFEADTLERFGQCCLLDAIAPASRDQFDALHRRALGGAGGTLEFQATGFGGTRRWLEIHAAPLAGADAAPSMLGIVRDIGARKEAQIRVQHLAHYDQLTGLPNRARLNELAHAAFETARREHQPVALMFLDLDDFKDINDALGHSVGDALLRELAGRLAHLPGANGSVARPGGDEFVFLFPGIDSDAARALARRVLDVTAVPYHIDQFELSLTASIGIALYPEHGVSLETLFQHADLAMYSAKRDGRNSYRVYGAALQSGYARRLELVTALRHALTDDQLEVHYQPQMSARTGAIVGAEALLRWRHPVLGQVSPAEFIPAAESSGLILPLGEWVLRQATRQAAAWLREGLAPMVMAVNLSAIQFRQPDLPDLVAAILEQEGLAPELLELELTEGTAMHDPQGAILMMNSLHETGVRLAIDDFGTGYSSLSLLKKFKIRKLKIDQSFVRDICSDAEDEAIVAAIINMARGLGLSTIAEGVERPDQLALLRADGCDEIQGYYYSKPLPAAQFALFARAHAPHAAAVAAA